MIVIEKGEDYKIISSNERYLIVEFYPHNYDLTSKDKIVVYGSYSDPSRLDATVRYYRKRVETIRAAIAKGVYRKIRR